MATRTAPEQAPEESFEASLEALEGVVERLESGELPLEQALAAFDPESRWRAAAAAASMQPSCASRSSRRARRARANANSTRRIRRERARPRALHERELRAGRRAPRPLPAACQRAARRAARGDALRHLFGREAPAAGARVRRRARGRARARARRAARLGGRAVHTIHSSTTTCRDGPRRRAPGRPRYTSSSARRCDPRRGALLAAAFKRSPGADVRRWPWSAARPRRGLAPLVGGQVDDLAFAPERAPNWCAVSRAKTAAPPLLGMGAARRPAAARPSSKRSTASACLRARLPAGRRPARRRARRCSILCVADGRPRARVRAEVETALAIADSFGAAGGFLRGLASASAGRLREGK